MQALNLIAQRDKKLQPYLRAMRDQVQRGCGMADAGFNTGLFDENHRVLIQAAEHSGKITYVYEQLALFYRDLDRRIKKLRSRLVFPVLTLIVALLIQPLPAMIAGEISGIQYAGQMFAFVMAIVVTGFAVVNIPLGLKKAGLQTVWDRQLLRWPLVYAWLTDRQLNTFFTMLGLLLEAGIAFSDALPKAVTTIRNRALQGQFEPAIAMSRSGETVVSILRPVKVIKPLTLQIIANGEQSGKLSESLLRWSRLEAETLALQDDAVAEWVPRLLYLVIAVWMAVAILTSGALVLHI